MATEDKNYMSKHLSLLLQAKEPQFHHTLARLETASGNVGHDIRLSESINQSLRKKLGQLGLDPEDTTGQELYHALAEKLKADESGLIKELRRLSCTHVSAEGNLSQGIAYTLKAVVKPYSCFGVKGSVVKRHIGKNPPKRTMKALGYRSLPSMLKHEPLALIISVAMDLESSSWEKRYRAMLKDLRPSDCEEKKLNVYISNGEKWDKLSLLLINSTKRTVLINNELATIIVLSVPNNDPSPGVTAATVSIAANGINSILSSSSYLRLSQVAVDFGARLEKTVYSEPELGVSFLEQPLNWETVQRFFHHMAGSVEESFDDHIDIEEIARWQPVEQLISKISPAMDYWKDTGHLGMLADDKPVSLNLLDNALNVCNRRDYNHRFYHHAQRNLWQEFILRYIRPDLIKEALNIELQPKLAAEYSATN